MQPLTMVLPHQLDIPVIDFTGPVVTARIACWRVRDAFFDVRHCVHPVMNAGLVSCSFLRNSRYQSDWPRCSGFQHEDETCGDHT